jgi:hypothetical protein
MEKSMAWNNGVAMFRIVDEKDTEVSIAEIQSIGANVVEVSKGYVIGILDCTLDEARGLAKAGWNWG